MTYSFKAFSNKTNYSFQVLIFLLVSFFLFAITSCGDEDETLPETKVTLNDVLIALGGETVISNTETMTYTVKGTAFEFEEEEPGLPNPQQVNDYELVVNTALGNRKLRLDYSKFDVQFPLKFSSNGALKIINDQEGTESGQYSVVSYYFGAVAPAPLQPSRIESDLKIYALSNPLELIKRYLSKNPGTNTIVDNKITIPTWIETVDIELVIDAETNLPKSASVNEFDFLHGDVKQEVVYNDWIAFDSIQYPTKLVYNFRENTVRTETISFVKRNQSSSESFTPEIVPTPIAYDADIAARGLNHSQWYNRLSSTGLPVDIPLDLAFVASDNWGPFGIPDQTISENVKLLGRPDVLYWGAAIKTSEGVLMVDAPLHPEYCDALITAAKSDFGFPNSEIIGVIPTHSHFDHFGGIREMAAEAGKVYVASEGKNNLSAVLNAPYDIFQDRLAVNQRVIGIEEVSGITILDDGAVEIHNVRMNDGGENPHSENMLIVYVPADELIIQADLFNAGALFALYSGLGAFPLDPDTKAIWKERAKFLLDYIDDKNLTVSKIVGIHGGLGTMEQLQAVAN